MNLLKIVRIVLFILLVITNLSAKDFFISFSFTSLNYQERYFEFNCAKALINKSSNKKFLFFIDCNLSILKCCYEKKEEIIDKLLKYKVIFFSHSNINNSNFKEFSKITFLPIRFDIIIKNGKMKFYLKDRE